MRRRRWDYSVRSAYFNLLNTLHLEHEVRIRHLIQGEYIFSMKAERSPSKKKDNAFRRPSLQEQSLISHDIKSSFNSCCLSYRSCVPYKQLKETVFQSLEGILEENTVSCRLLTGNDRVDILLPLLTALNSFLALGLLGEKKDKMRFLALLHPSLNPQTGNKNGKKS